MKNNNGKIAIAIVAMFVVALSVVGFTYAYFVASVNNNVDNHQVEVQAGVLKINYDNGQTLTATGIVPGWKSDNDMIYNSIASVSTKDGKTTITAVKKSTLSTVLTPEQIASSTSTEPVGPVTFTVKDQSTNKATAYYGIRLVEVTNGLHAVDPGNFKITLTEATKGAVTAADGYVLNAERTQKVSEAIAITGGATHTYTLNAEYVEAGSEQKGTGKNVTFTVEVVGLQLVNGKYVDAQGIEWK